MMLRRAVWIVLGVMGVGGMSAARGQSAAPACGIAPVVAANSQPNIFSEQQETWLGQVEADITESEIRPVRDAALGLHLQAIADRLVAVLPPTSIKFHVTLVDSEGVNGFSIAGGHVYILRKLAAVARNDDELAGVIGHEIGHIISHQFAFETTREMKRLLNVSAVGDEADIRTKYTAMLDAEYGDKHPELAETDGEQAEADRIGLYAMAAAGYEPKAYAEFWNRVFFVGGKTGSRIGDMLGITKPSQKRLRSIGAMVAAIPAGCGSGIKPDQQGFEKWHVAVVANQAGEDGERSVSLREVTLTPPLRMELDQVRFSPDGEFLLAQDQSSIFVIDRDPFAVRYRIDASGALPANFSPDSQRVTFSTPGLHVEEWSVTEKKLVAAHEMLPRKDCYDTRLSPDGRTMVCVEVDLDEATLGLAMLDTTSSEAIWEKSNWMEPSYSLAVGLLASKSRGDNTPFFISSYSSDGNKLLFAGGEYKTGFDLQNRTILKIGSGIRESISGDYAFIGSAKVVGINLYDHKNSGIFSFPDGKSLQKVNIPFSGLKSVSDPGPSMDVLTYGLKGYSVGLENLATSNMLIVLKTLALDEHNGKFAGEALGGALVLGALDKPDAKQQKNVALPLSPLPFYLPTALSKDGNYLAVSTWRRAAVWDLATGKQVALVSGFTDATWSDEGNLYMDVPKDHEVERHLTELSLKKKALQDLTYKVTDETHMRYGRLTDWKLDEKKKTWTLSLYDPATFKVIWSKVFVDRYFTYTASYGDRDLIFSFALNSRTGKELLKSNAALAAQASAIKKKENGRLVQVVDGRTGEVDGVLVVELPPNYAGTDGLNRSGDILYVQGVDDRTAVYSMSTGKMLRQIVGYAKAIDPATGYLFTTNRVGEGMVYDSAGLELAHYHVGDPIRFAQFMDKSTKVMLLTADQKVRVMEVRAATAAPK